MEGARPGKWLAAPAAQPLGKLLATASQLGEAELATASFPDNAAACSGKSAAEDAMRSMLRHGSAMNDVGRLAPARPYHPGSVEPAPAGLGKPPGPDATPEVRMEPAMSRTGVDLSKFKKNAVTLQRRAFQLGRIYFLELAAGRRPYARHFGSTPTKAM